MCGATLKIENLGSEVSDFQNYLLFFFQKNKHSTSSFQPQKPLHIAPQMVLKLSPRKCEFSRACIVLVTKEHLFCFPREILSQGLWTPGIAVLHTGSLL